MSVSTMAHNATDQFDNKKAYQAQEEESPFVSPSELSLRELQSDSTL